MNELVKTIDELYAAFKTDAELQAGKNNKAAGLRARKVSLELEKNTLRHAMKTSYLAAAASDVFRNSLSFFSSSSDTLRARSPAAWLFFPA